MEEYEYDARVRIIELIESFQNGTADMRELIYWLHAYSFNLANVPGLGALLAPLQTKGEELASIPRKDQELNWSPAAWSKVQGREAELVAFFSSYLESKGKSLLEAAAEGL